MSDYTVDDVKEVSESMGISISEACEALGLGDEADEIEAFLSAMAELEGDTDAAPTIINSFFDPDFDFEAAGITWDDEIQDFVES